MPGTWNAIILECLTLAEFSTLPELTVSWNTGLRPASFFCAFAALREMLCPARSAPRRENQKRRTELGDCVPLPARAAGILDVTTLRCHSCIISAENPRSSGLLPQVPHTDENTKTISGFLIFPAGFRSQRISTEREAARMPICGGGKNRAAKSCLTNFTASCI